MVLQDGVLAAWPDRYNSSVGLNRVGCALLHFWPEPAHASLLGPPGVCVVANHPVYPVVTKFFCCYWVCLVEVDLDQVPGLCSLSCWLMRKEAELVTAVIDGAVQLMEKAAVPSRWACSWGCWLDSWRHRWFCGLLFNFGLVHWVTPHVLNFHKSVVFSGCCWLVGTTVDCS
jgi:hypothetical protein